MTTTLTQSPQQAPKQSYPIQPAILKVADGVWYAGYSQGVLQFTCDPEQATVIAPEAFPHVVEECKKAGYGKKADRTLTHPEAAEKPQSYRYFVRLYSLDLDFEGDPCEEFTLDVVVVEPTAKAVIQLVTALGWLDDWRMGPIWQPETEADEF